MWGIAALKVSMQEPASSIVSRCSFVKDYAHVYWLACIGTGHGVGDRG